MTTDLKWGSASHQGKVRRLNEDAVLAGPAVFAVADGMGGHAGGEVASAIAIAELAAIQSVGTGTSTVIAALERTNSEIIRRAGAGEGPQGMGTTIAGIAAIPNGFVVFNLGDSRVYRFRQGVLDQLTEDHSLVAEMVRDGLLSETDARTHPKRNVITRALGVAETIEPVVFATDSVLDDVFIVASDGLFNELESAEMAAILGEDSSIEFTARRLVDAALSNGGRDNISVVLIRVGQPDEGYDLSEDTNPNPVVEFSDERSAQSADELTVAEAPSLITSIPGFGVESASMNREGDQGG